MNFLTAWRLLLVFFVLWLSPMRAQQVWHDEIVRTFQGLPSDIVLKTQTDDNGFVYIATAKGLSRYDGYRFVQSQSVRTKVTDFVSCAGELYFHDAVGLASVADVYSDPKIVQANNYQDENPDNDHFEHIFVDSKKRIWSSDFSNVKYFSQADKKPVIFHLDLGRKEENLKLHFVEISNGTIWALTSSGVFVWTENSGKLVRHPNPELAKLSCSSAIRLSKNRIVVATSDNKIIRIDPKIGKPEIVANSLETIIGMAKLPGRGLTLYSRNAVYLLFDKQLKQIYVPQKSQINHVLADGFSEILWISTNKGLVKLSPVDAISNFRIPAKNLENFVVTSIAEDNSRKLWLVENKTGLWSHDASGNFMHYDMPAVRVLSVSAYGNLVFIGTDKGLYLMESGKPKKVKLHDFGDFPIKKTVLTQKSELWLLVEGKPISRFSWPDLNPLQALKNKSEFWTENTWNDIFEAKNGQIWLGGWAPKAYGIDLFNTKNQAFIEVSDLKSNKNRDKFFGDYVNRIAENSDGNLLFSGYGGFSIVQPDGNLKRSIDINAYAIADGHFEGIASDGNGNIVFATGDGLHLYNQKRDDILRLSQFDGLPSDDLIYGFLKRRDGKFAIGTENGYALVNLQKLLEPLGERTLRLSGVSVDGKMRQHVSGAIELSKEESDATIFFSDLSFSEKNKIQYRYRFADEKHWNELGNSPEVSLNHIAPGTYNLVIQKKHAFGTWQKAGLELVLIAHPPFYRSPVFYVFCFLLAILSVTGIYSYLLRRQRKEAAFVQKIREAEMTTLRVQMNPHFMFNTLNSINSYIIQNQTESASDYLTTFSKLMRNILEYSKEELIPLDSELRALRLYMELESMRLEQSFDYTIKVDSELKGNPLVKVPPLIVQPFVENAIWHGLLHKSEPGNLLVKAEIVDEEKFCIRIEDDGIGRERAATLKTRQTSHKSYGIDITIERIRLLHPENSVEILDLKNADGSAKGTAVLITLKL
ncbi:histidine kinase [Flavobacterium sp.]|uniref:sensor histidine kinase n=1 Tax=Flavobacterium sp. TaxID=239 RepID=UPI00122B9A83|nr:histidine kinase [Flavobacterium sp.]RZJ72885.1 MAG: hypothetical protein EOO49_04425 [Flavobacterium sp.]